MNALHLCCLARAGLPAPSRQVGTASARETPDVSVVEVDGLAAIATPVALEAFSGAAGERNLQDPAWLIPRACAHEEAIEAVMQAGPVLPVRFGAVFSSRDALADFVAAHGRDIRRFLNYVADKEEWGVKVFGDLGRMREHLLAADPAFAERRRRLPATPGARYFQEKRLAADADRAVRLRCRAAAEEVQAAVHGAVVDLCRLRVQANPQSATRSSETPTGVRNPQSMEMVLNLAVLVHRERIADFRRQVERLAAGRSEQGMSMTASGPWPPFNFCPALGGPDE